VFWERLWRMSGINVFVFFIIAYVIYGSQPHVGALTAALTAFYRGDRTRILAAAVVSGMAVPQPPLVRSGARVHLGGCGANG
jgi:hypothetical protein